MLRLFLCFLAAMFLCSCGTQKHMERSSHKPFAVVVDRADTNLANEGEKKLDQGDVEDAIDIFQTLHLKYPEQPFFMISLADALMKDGDLDEALRYYQEALRFPLEEKEKMRAESGMAGIYLKKGRLSEAERLYLDIIEHDAQEWRALNGLGIITSLQGRQEESDFFFKAAIDLSHGHPIPRHNHAMRGVLVGKNAIAELEMLTNDQTLAFAPRDKAKLKKNLSILTASSTS